MFLHETHYAEISGGPCQIRASSERFGHHAWAVAVTVKITSIVDQAIAVVVPSVASVLCPRMNRGLIVIAIQLPMLADLARSPGNRRLATVAIPVHIATFIRHAIAVIIHAVTRLGRLRMDQRLIVIAIHLL